MNEIKIIDALGKPCPIPVIETKKALAEEGVNAVLVKVDNIVAVQNLEKMAAKCGYIFSYTENAVDSYDVRINTNGQIVSETKSIIPETVKNGSKTNGENEKAALETNNTATPDDKSGGLVVVISRDTMGEGAEALGKILIKGFIYSLTALPLLPKCVIFLNSGARLTSDGANTIDDLKKLEKNGTEILTCGTCINFYGLEGKLAAGVVTDMYGITQRMASAGNIINI